MNMKGSVLFPLSGGSVISCLGAPSHNPQIEAMPVSAALHLVNGIADGNGVQSEIASLAAFIAENTLLESARTLLTLKNCSVLLKLSLLGETKADSIDLEGPSSGLAYGLSIFQAVNLYLNRDYDVPTVGMLPQSVVATGALDRTGNILRVDAVAEKLEGVIKLKEKGELSGKISFFYPSSTSEIEQRKIDSISARLDELNIELFSVSHLREALEKIYGDRYVGIPSGQRDYPNPYMGLEHFDYSKRHLFFGRESEIEEFFDNFESKRASGKPAIVIRGPSGVGKSSLMHAGLLPKLVHAVEKDKTKSAHVVYMEPGQYLQTGLLNQLGQQLWSAIQNAEAINPSFTSDDLVEMLNSGASGCLQVNRYLSEFDDHVFILVFDQLEQIEQSILNDEKESKEKDEVLAFLKALKILCSDQATPSGLWLLASLREGTQHSQIYNDLLNHAEQAQLSALPISKVADIIRKPAELYRIPFESDPADNKIDVADRIIQDAKASFGESGSIDLVLLEYVLSVFFEASLTVYQSGESDEFCLLNEAYTGLEGGVEQYIRITIGQRDLEALNGIDKLTLSYLFARLIGIDQRQSGKGKLKPFAKWAVLEVSRARNLLEILLKSRLIIAKDSSNGERAYRFAHESLIRFWSYTRNWVQDNERYLRLQNRLMIKNQEWISLGKKSRCPSLILNKDDWQGINSADSNGFFFDESLDEYIEAARKRLKKKAYSWTGAAVALVCLLVFYWIENIHISTEYYREILIKSGVPFGVHKVSEADRSELEEIYEARVQGGKIISSLRMNGFGSPQGGFSCKAYEYAKSESRITHVKLFKRESYAPNDYCSYKSIQSKAADVENYTFSQKDGKLRAIVERLSNGKGVTTNKDVLQQTFSTFSGGQTDIAKTLIEYGEAGFPSLIKYLNSLGHATKDAYGIHGERLLFNRQGNLIERIFINEEGQKASKNRGLAGQMFEYDELGNRRNIINTNLEGNEFYDYDLQYAIKTSQFDGYRLKNETYKKANGDILKYRTFIYSEKTKRVTIYGGSREALLDNGGIHSRLLEYESDGQLSRVSYWNQESEPSLDNDAIHAITYTYDDMGNTVTEAYWGAEQESVLHKDGYHIAAKAYDSNGNITSVKYLGIDSEPTLNKYGIHRETRGYDIQGVMVEQAFWGRKNESTSDRYGVHRISGSTDHRGNVESVSYWGTDNKPLMRAQNYHKATRKYDEKGNLEEVAFWGTGDEAKQNKEGIHRQTLDHDEKGRLKKLSYWDLNGKPAKLVQGFTSVSFDYNDKGDNIEETFLGPDDRPVMSDEGYSRVARKYDEQGFLIEEAFFPRGDDHRITFQYDVAGNIAESYYFDVLGFRSPLHRWSRKYDDRRNIIEESFWGPDDKPVKIDKGYHRVNRRYDDKGNKLEEAYWGKENNPVKNTAGYHLRKWHYDNKGNVVAESLWDENLSHAENTDGISRLERVYNDKGQEVEVRFFDKNYVFMQAPQHPYAVYKSYDEGGNVIEKAFWFIDKVSLELTRHIEKYDEKGNKTEEALWGHGEAPATYTKGHHRVTWRHDDRGNVIEAEYWNQANERMTSNEGYYRVTMGYDEKGNLVEKLYWSMDRESLDVNRYYETYDVKGSLVFKAGIDRFNNMHM